MKSILILILLFSLSNHSSECVNDNSVCAFYCRKNHELKCGPDNYLMDFGYKYCRFFIKKENSYSKAGQPVFETIRKCLVNRLASRNDLTCQNVEGIAVDSHVECYVNSGFCELDKKDSLITLWYIRSALVDSTFLPTMKKIIAGCELRKKNHR